MKSWVCLLLSGLSFCLFMLKRAFEKNVVSTLIQLNRYTSSSELSIFFISDIHRRSISKKWIKKLPPTDIVMIGGDIMEKGVPFSRVEHNIRILKEVAPVFFVFGNNDEEVEKDRLESLLLKYEVTILENKVVKWHLEDGESIWLAGIGDINYQKHVLKRAISEINNEDLIVLMSHDPRVIHKLDDQQKTIDFILSGHTHGGQIRLFGYSPYDKGGMTTINNSIHLISNGFGTTLVPFRLGAKSETHHIIFQKKKSDELTLH